MTNVVRMAAALLLLCGVGQLKANRPMYLRIVYSLYSALVLTVTVICTLRCIMEAVEEYQNFRGFTVLSIVSVIYPISMLQCLGLSYHSIRVYFGTLKGKPMLELLLSHLEGCDVPTSKTSMLCTWIALFSGLISALFHPVTLVLTILNVPGTENLLPGSYIFGSYSVILNKSILAVVSVLMELVYTASLTIYAQSCNYLTDTGFQLQRQIHISTADNTAAGLKSAVNKVWLGYFRVAEEGAMVDDFYRTYAFALLSTSSLFVIGLLFVTTTKIGTGSDFTFVACLGSLVIQILRLTVVMSGARLGTLSQSFWLMLKKRLVAALGAEARGEGVVEPGLLTSTRDLMHLIQSDPVCISVGGLFPLANSVVLTLVSIIATYYIILTQFYQSVSSNAAPNVTCICAH